MTMFTDLGQMLIMFKDTLKCLPHALRERKKILDQLFEIGNGSLAMSCFLSLFIGGVMALQTGPFLSERGLGSFIGGILGLSVTKEIAPILMSVLMAGRIGSAMAAEIGSMRVNQEIDALCTMNINPIRFLVLPRIVAITLALPTLVVFSIMVAWLGGAMVCFFVRDIGISFQTYFSDLAEVVDPKHLFHGVLKSITFAVSVGLISCHRGMTTSGGPREIGWSVTRAVVDCMAAIVILDYFLTRFLMLFNL